MLISRLFSAKNWLSFTFHNPLAYKRTLNDAVYWVYIVNKSWFEYMSITTGRDFFFYVTKV